jgi:SLT domain-containing protein
MSDHPSEGIAQVIGPTFHAYKLHGYGDIWNPVDNMIAASGTRSAGTAR